MFTLSVLLTFYFFWFPFPPPPPPLSLSAFSDFLRLVVATSSTTTTTLTKSNDTTTTDTPSPSKMYTRKEIDAMLAEGTFVHELLFWLSLPINNILSLSNLTYIQLFHGYSFFFYFFYFLFLMTRHTGRIVVYYKCGVYDATDFSGHPGGVGRLEMAAGVSFLK